MAGLSKVIVLDRDARAARQVVLGFLREGIAGTVAETVEAIAEDVGLVVVGGTPDGLAMVTAARASLAQQQRDVPIVFAGTVGRKEALAAGADEAMDATAYPVFLRDVVTIGRMFGGTTRDHRAHVVGQLAELTNCLTLIRALAALGRSATLTLMRGLRRGEVRFYHGEVTSAELGLIHGQAALHQLLLWTDARFDFRLEDVVRRQQIPLTNEELLGDAERFLEGIRESSGVLSPSLVLEQDAQRVHGLGKQVPTEVHGVLRMFDGHRVLADVLEDSPYRVFETLRVAQRALEAGLLRVVQNQRPKATWRAMLAIDEWLVGKDRDGVVERATADLDSEPVSAPTTATAKSDKKGKKKRSRKQRRANTPVPVATVPKPVTIDWGALVPRAIGVDHGTLSPVVPASRASGEIELPPSRELEREGLESLMDTQKRGRIFSADAEPKVVFDDGSPDKEVVEVPVADAVRDIAQDKVRAAVKQQAIASAPMNDAEARRALEAKHVSSSGRDRLEKQVRARRESEEMRSVIVDGAAAEARAREAEAAATARRVEAEIKAANDAAAAKLAAEEAAKAAAEAKAKAAADDETTKARALAAAFKGTTEQRLRDEAEARVIAGARAAMAVGDTVSADPKAEPSTATELVAALLSDARDAPATATVPVREAVPSAPLADVDSHPLAAIPVAALAAATAAPTLAADAATLAVAATRAAEEHPPERKSADKIESGGSIERPRAKTSPPRTRAKTSPGNIAGSPLDKTASDLRHDASHFSDDEEAFFNRHEDKHPHHHAPTPHTGPVETFDDLDEGYERVGFWDRLMGRKKPKKK